MPDIPQQHRKLTIDPYLVDGPWPRSAPLAGGFSVSSGFAGTNVTNTGLAAALSVDPGAGVFSRWLPDPTKFVDNGDGTTRWLPSAGDWGSGLSPRWRFNNVNLPGVQTDYSYMRRRGEEFIGSCVAFEGDDWGNLNLFPVNRSDFALLMVARLTRVHAHYTAGIVESVLSGTDSNSRKSDVWLRLDGNYIRASCLGYHTDMYIHQTGRPQIIAVTHYTRGSRLFVFDTKLRMIEWNHPNNYWGFDTNMNLGRAGGPYDAARTVHMDLLDLVMWEGAITQAEMMHAIHALNSVYGLD